MDHILIVEDEGHLADGLRFNLEAEGYRVTVAESGERALDEVARLPIDLIVLDVMLPGIDGFAVARRLRAAQNFVSILMLTARGSAEDVLAGFAAGADDYLAKPFELAILRARIQGLLRRRHWLQLRPPDRPQAAEQERLSINGRTVDFSELQLRHGDQVWPLTLMEANLLRFLAQHTGKAVSRKAMLEQVWGVREDTDTRAIDNFIVRLRRYLEDDPGQPRHLITVRGVGYRLQL